MKNYCLQLTAKRAFFFAMPYYCLKPPTSLLPKHQQTTPYPRWLPLSTGSSAEGKTRLFTHLFIDRKNKEDMIETP
jgi:hypothetical protein